MARIPMRASAATPPTTTPAIRPVDTLDFLVVEEAVAGAEVEPVVDWGVVEVGLVIVAKLEVGLLETAVGALLDARDAVGLAELVVEVGGARLGTRILGTAVGMSTTLWLERKELTTPPMLDRKLLICRPCTWYLLSVPAYPTLHAARQNSFLVRSAAARLGWDDGAEAWFS
jgi:hypothetical protein